MKKRLFSILLVLCMALTMLPVTALAGVVSEAEDISIKNLRWKFENDGEIVYYISDGDGVFTQTQPESGSYLKLTKNDKEITATVVGNVEITAHGISCDTVWTDNSLLINGSGSLIVSYKMKEPTQNYNAIQVYSLTVDGISLTAEASMGYAIYAFEGIEIKNGASVEAKSGRNAAIQEGTSNLDGDRITGGITVENAKLTATMTGWGKFSAIKTNGNVTVTNAVVNAVNVVSSGATIEAKYKNSVNYLYVSGTSTITATNESTSEDATSKAITATIRNNNTNAKIEVNGIKVEAGKSCYCDAKKATIISPAPHTHTFDNTWTSDATNHWKTCKDCDAIIEEAAHNYGDWIIDKKPTDTEAGSKHKECTVCQYKTQTETIPAIGHTHTFDNAWHDMGNGCHAHKCTCGAFDTASREAHHEFPCESKGLEKGHTLKCLLCEYKYDESIIKPHEWTGWKVYDSYYEYTNGHHAKRCNCGQLDYCHTQLVYQSIDAEWHQRVCPIAGCGYKEQRKSKHVYENGSTVCKYCNFDKSNPTDPAPVEPTPGGSVIIITPEATGPVFLSGANQTVALGSAAAFRIDYNYAAFRSVAVDGVTLTPADYTTWEGSTWVKLTPTYVKTLGIGTHTLSVYFDGATATTTFTVGSQPNPATGARDAVGIAAAAAVIALLGSAALLRKK